MQPSKVMALLLALILLVLLPFPDTPNLDTEQASPRRDPILSALKASAEPFFQSFQAKVAGNTLDGIEISCDLPEALHQKNTGGSDGAGLCVFASMRHTGLWQNDPVFAELFNWMRNHPGGSYPTKTDQMIAKFCQEKGYPKPDYLQVESNDLEILKLACRTGRMPGVTYGFSPSGRYGGASISHMVSLPHADDKYFVVLDNNYPKTYEWNSPDEFGKAYKATGGKGWAIILLTPPPPPAPRN